MEETSTKGGTSLLSPVGSRLPVRSELGLALPLRILGAGNAPMGWHKARVRCHACISLSLHAPTQREHRKEGSGWLMDKEKKENFHFCLNF